MTTPRSVTVRAAAKINLHLGVGAPRADGFHPLVTVYQAVAIYDDLTATRATGWDLRVEVVRYLDPATVPPVGGNIVDRAATLLAAHHGVPLAGELHLHKEIPVAGGMAGGSADAAAALVALDRLWDAGTSDDDLLGLAGELGSDIPFALVGGTALGTGRGEMVVAVPDASVWWWVVVPSTAGLSTPDVYRRFDELSPGADAEPATADALLNALATGEPPLLAAALRNDLQDAALDLRPELGDTLARGEAAGALRGLVSGSGPTCAFLCRSAGHARAVAAELAERHDVVLVAHGPVAGAHVVDTS
jgi:4-diphosphocytidyl-2-C-methyl-D-erythritol kinase